MKKYTTIPAITGKQLIKLLKSGTWKEAGKAKHGITLTKGIGDRTRVTLVPDKVESLPKGTLGAILGPMQTGLGKSGLLRLLNKYGLK